MGGLSFITTDKMVKGTWFVAAKTEFVALLKQQKIDGVHS